MPAAPAAPFRLYLVTDRAVVVGGDLAAAVRRALTAAPPGTVGIQLREKDLEARELFALACALRPVTRAAGAALLVNDRLDVALAAEADGVHLPGGGLPVAEARRLLGPRGLVGVSTHRPEEVAAAAAAGADLAVFGPIFPTPSKARYGPPQGLEALGAAAGAAALPVYALGGVDAGNAATCVAAGAAGVAAIRAVLAAADPAAATAALLNLLGVPS